MTFSFPFFIKVVVNKSKAYSFLIIGIMHLQKNITFSYNAAILFFSLLSRALEYTISTEVLHIYDSNKLFFFNSKLKTIQYNTN